jgi:uncharacterized protein YecE (DUF72 family)
VKVPSLRVGTSSWSSADWRGVFYPEGASATSFLPHYSEVFDTVECDATFYGVPSTRTVDGWREKTPAGFLFSAKLPQEITHEKGLVGCEAPLAAFLAVLDRLGEKLGPILAQFPYVAKGKDPREYAAGDDFRRRLGGFLDAWPAGRPLAVEVRNAGWIAPPLLDLLRARGVALTYTAYYTMPGPEKLFAGPDPQTAGFVYARFIGDHKRMDALVAKQRAEGSRSADWNAPALDRSAELARWMGVIRARASVPVLAYFNNHYAGFAPGSARLFRDLWEKGA